MRKKQITLTLTWRDENYGSVFNAKAFRTSINPSISDTALQALGRMFRRKRRLRAALREEWAAC